jgi:hypothetical protein
MITAESVYTSQDMEDIKHSSSGNNFDKNVYFCPLETVYEHR